MKRKRAGLCFGALGVLVCLSASAEPKVLGSETAAGTLLEKVQVLYSQGHMPDLKDFPVGKILPATVIYSSSPDTQDSTNEFVALEEGDAVLGPLLYAGVFVPGTGLPDATRFLLGKEPGSVLDPLRQDKSQDAIVSLSRSTEPSTCGMALWFRKVSTASAPRVLVFESVASDTSPQCNPNSMGVSHGQLAGVGYTVLP